MSCCDKILGMMQAANMSWETWPISSDTDMFCIRQVTDRSVAYCALSELSDGCVKKLDGCGALFVLLSHVWSWRGCSKRGGWFSASGKTSSLPYSFSSFSSDLRFCFYESILQNNKLWFEWVEWVEWVEIGGFSISQPTGFLFGSLNGFSSSQPRQSAGNIAQG